MIYPTMMSFPLGNSGKSRACLLYLNHIQRMSGTVGSHFYFHGNIVERYHTLVGRKHCWPNSKPISVHLSHLGHKSFAILSSPSPEEKVGNEGKTNECKSLTGRDEARQEKGMVKKSPFLAG